MAENNLKTVFVMNKQNHEIYQLQIPMTANPVIEKQSNKIMNENITNEHFEIVGTCRSLDRQKFFTKLRISELSIEDVEVIKKIQQQLKTSVVEKFGIFQGITFYLHSFMEFVEKDENGIESPLTITIASNVIPDLT